MRHHDRPADAGLRVLAVAQRDLDPADWAEFQQSGAPVASLVDDLVLVALVSPEHKLRLVSALQACGEVVAMTGDGVNDAPALRQADIGIAMGITGTEVSKEAASMVLTDDYFATIIAAIERGRTIYDNIVKFVRFQLSTTLGFALLCLLVAVLDVSSGKPFGAIAILWVNVIMDGPPAMALGVDPAGDDVMSRPPRPPHEPILTRERWRSIGIAATVMSLGTLAVLAWGPGDTAAAGTPTTAGTMAFTTFVLFQFFNILNVRSQRMSVFTRSTFSNRWLWVALAVVIGLQVMVTTWGPLQRLFDVVSLGATEWAVCILGASCVLGAEEALKIVRRRT